MNPRVEVSTRAPLELTEPGVLAALLPLYKAAPLVGLEYVVEVHQDRGDPHHTCLLCRFESGTKDLMYHLLSAQHRLTYLVNNKFNNIFNLK